MRAVLKLQIDKSRMSTELLCMTIQQGHLHVPIADATQFDHRLKGEFRESWSLEELTLLLLPTVSGT